MSSVPTQTAAGAYARSLGERCAGRDLCRNCGGRCDRSIQYNDARTREFARQPDSPFLCRGCSAWGRRSITIPFLGGGLLDGQSPKGFGWLITPPASWAVRPTWAIKPPVAEAIYSKLLRPPPEFALLLLEGKNPPPNLIQCAALNVTEGLRADTPLRFTVNNVPQEYTVYELEQGGLYGASGRLPGVQALLRILGPIPEILLSDVAREPEKEKRERGRPPVPSPDPRVGQQTRSLPTGSDT